MQNHPGFQQGILIITLNKSVNRGGRPKWEFQTRLLSPLDSPVGHQQHSGDIYGRKNFTVCLLRSNFGFRHNRSAGADSTCCFGIKPHPRPFCDERFIAATSGLGSERQGGLRRWQHELRRGPQFQRQHHAADFAPVRFSSRRTLQPHFRSEFLRRCGTSFLAQSDHRATGPHRRLSIPRRRGQRGHFSSRRGRRTLLAPVHLRIFWRHRLHQLPILRSLHYTNPTRFVGRVSTDYYPIDNLRVGASFTTAFHDNLAKGEIEYQTPINGLALTGEAALGNNGYDHWLLGVRYYFGGKKSLRDRQRQDDPRGLMPQILHSLGVYGAEFNRKENAYIAAHPSSSGNSGGGGYGLIITSVGEPITLMSATLR